MCNAAAPVVASCRTEALPRERRERRRPSGRRAV